MTLKRGYKTLIAEAEARIQARSPVDAQALLTDENVVFVDIRDVRELDREGTIPDAVHAPRGMLEFWVDPESPYHKPVFSSGKQLVLFWQSGWRSALATATLVDMGVPAVSHLQGGFGAWKEAQAPIVPRKKKA